MFAEAIPLAAHQKAADYTVAKARLGIVDTVLDAAILLALTLGGALQWLADLWARAFAVESLWHGTALILSVLRAARASSGCRSTSTAPSSSRSASASTA